MKVELHRWPPVSPQMLETLAAQSSDTARHALAAFVKRLIEEGYRPAPELAGSTTAPPARRSEQTSENTQNHEPKKGKTI